MDFFFSDEDKIYVKTGEFVKQLWKEYNGRKAQGEAVQVPSQEGASGEAEAERETEKNATLSEIFLYARKKGWLEEQDILKSDEPIERRRAARILHEFLVRELKETDITEIGRANRLADLFDCRTCVGHVSQVFLKGIMDSREVEMAPEEKLVIFDMRDGMTPEEMKDILERTFDEKKRSRID